jgi:hypothetical protein
MSKKKRLNPSDNAEPYYGKTLKRHLQFLGKIIDLPVHTLVHTRKISLVTNCSAVN